MKLEKIQIGDKKVWPFTIPSGIVMTQLACLEKLAYEIDEIGILTTKSIGPEPRAGNREPILHQYYLGCWVNAVGLTNPGAEEFAKELAEREIPKDKFLLASIFGASAEEFVYVAKTLENFVDGFELNLSCPHAAGHGLAIGQDAELSETVIKEVRRVTMKEICVKFGANIQNLGERAKNSLRAGANGFVLINTFGPGCYSVDGHPVLKNINGGMSGRGILPLGIKAVRDVRETVGKESLIIAMGGIATVKDAEEYAAAGTNAFGIGSALAGMNDLEIKAYFSALADDLRSGWTNNASSFLKDVDTNYKKVRVTKVVRDNCDLGIYQTDESIEAKPGQFVFAWIPGIGEKPFSVMDDNPLTLGVLARGEFTKKFNELKKGDEFYVRGPYGQGVSVAPGSDVVLVGGGCGIAGIYLLAKKLSKKANIVTLLGAKDKQHLIGLDELSDFGGLQAVTEDGSFGRKGTVKDLLEYHFFKEGSYFFNCGPKAMVDAILPLELKTSDAERIYSSLDYMTMCGVGICGRCVDNKGRRTCVEGPFMRDD